MTRLRYTFAIPVLLAGVTGGFIGWTVTRLGCDGTSCSQVANAVVGLLTGLVAAAGVGIVVVLADRSLREWNEWRAGSGGETEDGARDTNDPAGLG